MTTVTCDHSNYNTHCTVCRRRSADASQRRRARKRQGQHLPSVDADTIRDHITNLRDAGMSLNCIADEAGLSRSALAKLSCGLQQRVQGATAEKILAVTPRPAARVGAVPVAGPARRIRALCALGWSLPEQAARVGTSVSAMWVVAHQRQSSVTVHFANRIARVYDDLYATDPQPTPASRRVRELAESRRWPGPEAWTDTTIDDPAAKPAVSGGLDDVLVQRAIDGNSDALAALNKAERLEAVRRLLRRPGITIGSLPRLLNVSGQTANRLAAQALEDAA